MGQARAEVIRLVPFICRPGLPPTVPQMDIDLLSGGSSYTDLRGWVLHDEEPVTNPTCSSLASRVAARPPPKGAAAEMDLGYRALILGDAKDVLGDLPLRVAYERLTGMVRTLGEDVQAMALRNAYAIDMLAPDALTGRRERIAGIHGLSIDTIEPYERNMIDELALRLVHGELPVGN